MSYSTHHAYVNMGPSMRLVFMQLLGVITGDREH